MSQGIKEKVQTDKHNYNINHPPIVELNHSHK